MNHRLCGRRLPIPSWGLLFPFRPLAAVFFQAHSMPWRGDLHSWRDYSPQECVQGSTECPAWRSQKADGRQSPEEGRGQAAGGDTESPPQTNRWFIPLS